MADVTREELWRLREELAEQMSSGFDRLSAAVSGVHQRLDVLNGRTGKSEVLLAEYSQKTVNLEREVFSSQHSRDRRRPELNVSDDDQPALTRREWKLIWGFVTVLASLVAWLVSALR